VAAALQLVANAGLAAALWLQAPNREFGQASQSSGVWYALAAAPFAAIACWGVAEGKLGEPAPDLVPVWAARGSYLQAIGEQLLSAYFVPLLLAALLLLVAVVATAYLAAGDTEEGAEGR
jgi:NADH:ubiquinone oxidoreductase subunit 6 (subunit J)